MDNLGVGDTQRSVSLNYAGPGGVSRGGKEEGTESFGDALPNSGHQCARCYALRFRSRGGRALALSRVGRS